MKRLVVALLLLASACGAQTIAVYPRAIPAVPANGYQTISAVVTGVAKKTVSWSTSGGTLVGTNPCTDALTAPCTIALHATTPGTYTVTATSNANGSVTATSTVTVIADPTPLTTHPRLYFTSADISKLQAKAASGNVVWTAMQSAADTEATADDAAWGRSGGGGGYTCDGGTGVPNAKYIIDEQQWVHSPELDAYTFALMANIDPSSSKRTRWACRAHDLYLYTMQSILVANPGETTGCACMGSPNFLLGNRGSSWGTAVGTTLDWVYSTFTSGDFTTIRAALLSYEHQIATNTTIADGHPAPIGAKNSSALIPHTTAGGYGYVRASANNYALGHGAELMAMGLALDAANDPATSHCDGGYDTVCPDGKFNSVRAGFHYGLGAYLFVQWLNFEDPAVTTTAYNAAYGTSMTPTAACNSNEWKNPTPLTATVPCYGGGRGGLSMEGSLYLGWLVHLRSVALMLHSSGNDDPTKYPQISFDTSSWWDLHWQGYLHDMTPALYTKGGNTAQLFFAYGPVNNMYDVQSFLQQPVWTTLAYDARDGRTDRANEMGWLGGNVENLYSLTQQVAQYPPVGVDLFLGGGTGSAPFSRFTDPRPTMPPAYYSYNSGQLITSSGAWSSTSGGVFRVYCPKFPFPDHEEGYCTTFDFYLDGDWATKGRSGYALNDQSGYRAQELPDYSNNSGYANNPSVLPDPTRLYYIDPFADRGGQFSHGLGTGANINNVYDDMPGYTYAHYETTGQRNLYFSNTSMQDIRDATREFFWLKSNFLLIYDRGDTGKPAFKRQWFNATGATTISSGMVSWPSPLHKTSNYLHVLLQGAGNINTYPAYPFMTSSAEFDYAPAGRILIDAGMISHATETYHTTAIVPAHQVNLIADTGVTGGARCSSFTQVGAQTTPGSCQYNVTVESAYTVSSADASAGVTIHYDYSTPTTTMRSLNVLESQKYGTAAAGATLIQQSAGQNFDGALVGSSLVLFMRTPAAFTGVTYPASGATTHYISNLRPNTSYPISGTGAPSTATTDDAGLLTFAATGTGSIILGSAAPPLSASRVNH